MVSLAVIGWLLSSSLVEGIRKFDDDVAFEDKSNTWVNIWPKGEDDCDADKWASLTPEQIETCKRWSSRTYTTKLNPTKDTGRSMVHMDATYVIAQAVGFSAEAAFWIAAYDEAVDKGSFKPTNECGNFLSPDRMPEDMTGFNRFHLCAGGSEFHYLVKSSRPNASRSALDLPFLGKEPTEEDWREDGQLVQTRTWALGERSGLCVNGITAACDGQSTSLPGSGACYQGDACFCGGTEKKTWPAGPDGGSSKCISDGIFWKASFLGIKFPYLERDPDAVFGYTVKWGPLWSLKTSSGDQRITFEHTEDSNRGFQKLNLLSYATISNTCPKLVPNEYTNLVWSSDIDAYLAKGKGRFQQTGKDGKIETTVPSMLARLGVWMHQLQDAISHHTCYDNSFMEGPKMAESGDSSYFEIVYSRVAGHCDTGSHTLHHYWELGQGVTWPATSAGLLSTYRELQYFAEIWSQKSEFNFLFRHGPRIDAQQLIGSPTAPGPLLTALAAPGEGQFRVTSISEVIKQFHLEPIPGTSCGN